ncbi:mycothiol system anti-sigma-R factor [Calidifontibacter sp. DB0510]|uniref:Mycothiol system anti-sigma-R factor n=1 Tax=Metallococcus carri TaxID=1656884 RepID=A0A967B359_9MICO|nr:mycothiol system anti-sigma-R factor [Metallococcus carri]NHN56425.1 mycothiol system anti-sigma-R factor [Metallococcus carri]NOP36049.1 mycothiol system anti-sigma-R factor [Calidifontibacter sp. DB2511S]
MIFDDHADCASYLEHLYEFLDGELTDDDRAALAAHLQDCPPCLNEYERDLLMKALVRRSCQCESAPAELRTRIMAQISVQVTTVQVRRYE